MIRFFKDIFGVFATHRKGVTVTAIVTFGVILFAAITLKIQMTDSEFCDTCHFMDPYVKHWKESSHSEVECIQCHDYSLTEIAGDALTYWTGTYDRRPKSNVHDEKCLASGCHDTQSLAGSIAYRKNILFDHSVHLDKKLRGGKLRCTSCHNQIVQFSDDARGHMTVNDKSCFVCHFKDAGLGEAITGCDACHGMPEQEVEHAGFTFNHKPYLELNVECKQCHVNIVAGDGSVPESKCHDCHVERSQDEYDHDALHAIHVTTQGIDCYRCHTDIRHGNFTMAGALEIECESCHLRQHNRPKQLYMGIGGHGGHDLPSGMFTAQVSCSGCHTHRTPEGEPLARQEKKEATRTSCVTCHGDGYDLMFDNWLTGSAKLLAQYDSFLKKANRDLAGLGGDRKLQTRVQAALSQAEYNYHFVSEGHIPHNIAYAILLLNASADEFTAAMREIKKSYTPPSRGRGLDKNLTCREFCHGNAFFPEVVDNDGDELPHLLHTDEMELKCESCHPLGSHGTTKINETVCEECH